MTKRREWAFPYTCAEVQTACTAQLDYHEQRLSFWAEEAERAEADLRAHGVEIREQAVTGGNRVNLILDPDRQRRLEECREKWRSHEAQAAGYRAYLVGLGHMDPSSILELDADDIVWFGLVDSASDDDDDAA